jgi:hypothetical protein
MLLRTWMRWNLLHRRRLWVAWRTGNPACRLRKLFCQTGRIACPPSSTTDAQTRVSVPQSSGRSSHGSCGGARRERSLLAGGSRGAARHRSPAAGSRRPRLRLRVRRRVRAEDRLDVGVRRIAQPARPGIRPKHRWCGEHREQQDRGDLVHDSMIEDIPLRADRFSSEL